MCQHSLKTLKLAEFVIGMDGICGVSGASKECGSFWVGSNIVTVKQEPSEKMEALHESATPQK
jgi:hypothetical protein